MRAIAYGASALVLMALAAPAAADTVPFVDITPGPTTFTAPETGVYDILAFGANGGASAGFGGLGAEVGGDFNLTGGRNPVDRRWRTGSLDQRGRRRRRGTFVLTSTGTALLIAGGGGGAGFLFHSSVGRTWVGVRRRRKRR